MSDNEDKRPKSIIKEDKKREKELKNISNKYKYKFGIFKKGGYRVIKYYVTKEEAEADLERVARRACSACVIREIIEWSND